MGYFWFSTLLIIAVAIVFVALPLFKRSPIDDKARRDELNKAFYKDRLAELEQDEAEGIVADREELLVDLKQSLLDDIPLGDPQAQSKQVSGLLVFVPAVLLVALMSYGLYMTYGSLDQVAHWQRVNGQLPSLSKKLMSSDQTALTEQEMSDITLGLRTRLHYQPDDAAGWLLLGRVALSNRDGGTAAGAMNKAYQLQPEDPDIRLGYAQSLMTSQHEADQRKAKIVLIGLLQDNYVDLRVYSLLAFSAYQQAEYKEAVRYWKMMQQLIGEQDSRYAMLERSIASAEQKMGTPIANNSVSITLSLANQVQLASNGVLIVSIHDGNGSPIPVAAARFPIGTFPRTVVLDDGNVMLEGQSLGQLKTIVVKARIDTDGNVATKQGDWFGESAIVELGDQVEFMIDKQY